jgi:hypothetical protein
METNHDNPEDLCNRVWQSFLDDKLQAMTPPRFYEALGDDVEDEAAEDAWEIFHARQKAVFA